MNKINLKNYEAYFLDFSEGNLSHTETEDLRDFLIMHPQLKKELDEFEQPLLTAEESFDHSLKACLYREETTGLPILDYLMIAQVEETISSEEKSQLRELINNDETIISDLSIYHKTKLTADKKYLYPNKKALLKKDNKVAFWANVVSAAAAAALIISLLNIEFADEQYRPIQFSYSAVQLEDQKTVTVQQQLAPQENKSIAPKAKNTALQQSIPNNNSSQTEKRIEVSKIQTLAFQPITSNDSTYAMEKNMKKIESIPSTINEPELIAQNEASLSGKEFPPLTKLASQKIKTDVLKNKSLKDVFIEELAELSDNRLSLPETQKGKTQRFAINIGKFSYSNF